MVWIGARRSEALGSTPESNLVPEGYLTRSAHLSFPVVAHPLGDSHDGLAPLPVIFLSVMWYLGDTVTPNSKPVCEVGSLLEE